MEHFLVFVESAALIYTTFGRIQDQTNGNEQRQRQQAEEAFRKLVVEGLHTQRRIAFGLNLKYVQSLTSSVAVEEVHACYLAQCSRQRSGGQANNGCVFVVYSLMGSGKTSATVALLAMKHSQAPKKALWFGGETSYASGDAYFDGLLDHRIANGTLKLSTYETGIFSPYGLARFLLEKMQPHQSDLESSTSAGTMDVPGLRPFLKGPRFGRSLGGTPVIVFDDVNIELEKRDPTKTDHQQVAYWMGTMGKAGLFFDTLITQGHESGIIVFVTTRSFELATFFSIFNGQEKSSTFKPLTKQDTLECQFFNWNKEKRVEFLKLQNDTKKASERASATLIEQVADESIRRNYTIRTMHGNFDDECATLLPLAAASESAEAVSRWGWCGGGCFG